MNDFNPNGNHSSSNKNLNNVNNSNVSNSNNNQNYPQMIKSDLKDQNEKSNSESHFLNKLILFLSLTCPFMAI